MAPSYHRLGEVPRKRHVAFRAPDGGLYNEEVVGLEGFSGRYSILYHRYAPTRVLKVAEADPVPAPPVESSGGTTLRHHLFRTGGVGLGDGLGDGLDELGGRRWLLFNGDVRLGLSDFGSGPGRYTRNGAADEIHFVHHGRGRLESTFGVLEYVPGDYVVIPKGTTHRWVPAADGNRHLVIETPGAVRLPRRYQNGEGQLLEHAPYWERDFRRPLELVDRDDQTPTDVWVRVGDRAAVYTLDHDPLDVVGWDGHLYPYAFSIHDFEPISGRQHQPPPVHQTFELDGAVVCSFCPRRLDDGPDVVTAPYNHANLDSDEVIYYVSGSFFSRRGIEEAAVTWHPRGIPHGPAPDVAEASIGKTHTDELAVMVDTFRPLTLAAGAEAFDDPAYPTSWLPTP
ncbi:MAG TPA: homogentisate 1,2-dioxygenase [Acidimicrobiales bacterium]|jgi:homogentisate 1,2-dioxygenase|nr:homogentisate 1,2-dioxygenase [Acidimicrobiales bacterium]